MLMKMFFYEIRVWISNANWDIESIKTNFNSQIAEKFNMSWEIYTQEYKPKLLYLYLNTTIAYTTF
jgi:formyltetrahydrofolate deformylase